jgi:hypothetical protein
MNITDTHLGCWIDGSHNSSVAFNHAVIEMACERFGFDIDLQRVREDIYQIENEHLLDFNEFTDIVDSLYWTSEQAVEHMNDTIINSPYYFEVEDQCLFLEKDTSWKSLDPADNPW